MNIANVNLICWAAFGLAWILGAVYNLLKAPRARARRDGYDWLVLTILLGGGMHLIPNEYLHFAPFHLVWLKGAGLILLIVSTVYTLWSRWVLGKMWASNAAVKEGHQLVTNGPYKITRHPIYTGILGMILGSLLSMSQGIVFLIAFVIVLIFFMNRIRNEEKLMVMTFGEQYIEYRKRVPQLIPGLKPRNK